MRSSSPRSACASGKRISAAENVGPARDRHGERVPDREPARPRTRGANDAPRARTPRTTLGRLLESTRWTRATTGSASGRSSTSACSPRSMPRARDASDGSGLAWPMSLVPSAYRWHPQPDRGGARRPLSRSAPEVGACSARTRGCSATAQRAAVRPPGFADLLAPNAMGRIVIDAIRARSFDHIQLQRCQLETHVSLVAGADRREGLLGRRGRAPRAARGPRPALPRRAPARPLRRLAAALCARRARGLLDRRRLQPTPDRPPRRARTIRDAPGLSLAF